MKIITISKLNHLRDVKIEFYSIESKIIKEYSKKKHSKEIEYLIEIKKQLSEESKALEKEVREWLKASDMYIVLKQGCINYYIDAKGFGSIDARVRNNFYRDLKHYIYHVW